MAGGKWAQKIQLAREGESGDAGTHVPADYIWRGDGGNIKDARETVAVEERIGIALPTTRNYSPKLMAELDLAATPFTPEQAVYLFDAGLKSVASGTQESESSGRLWKYQLGGSSLNDIAFWTLEGGDNEAVEAVEHAFVSEFTLTGNAGENVQMSGKWIGRQSQASSFAAGATAPTVTEVDAAGLVYINGASESYGSSQVSAGNILSFELNVTTGWVPRFTVDSGSKVFQGVKYDKDAFSWDLNLTFVHDDQARNEKAAWRNNDARHFRLDFAGDDLGSTGDASATTFQNRLGLQIDTEGIYTDFEALGDEEGDSTMDATVMGGYDNTNASLTTIRVVNEIASGIS